MSRILLIRLDGIGDALVCVPLLAALRSRGDELGAALTTRNAGIYVSSAVAHEHVLERLAWPAHGSAPPSRVRALDEIRAARYDVALIASEELEAYRLAYEAEIPVRVGFSTGWAKPLKSLQLRRYLTHAIVRPATARGAREHEVETIYRLGAHLVYEPKPPHEPGRLEEVLFEKRPAAHGRVVLQLNAKLRADGLDGDVFAALARRLQSHFDLLAVADNSELAERVAADGIDVRTNLGLREWMELLAGARAVVTPDSGAAHVAGMCGVPCVDLFADGATTNNDTMRWRPWAAPSVALHVARDTAAAVPEHVVRSLEALGVSATVPR